MARRASKVNVMRFMDTLSQDKNGKPSIIGLKYRKPTTEERQGYLDDRRVRSDKTGEFEDRTVETRLKYGLEILTGIEDGSFEDEDENGNYHPVSSDPASEHYMEAWKDFVEEHGSDIVTLFAIRVFEGSCMPAPLPKTSKKPAGKKRKRGNKKEDVDRD